MTKNRAYWLCQLLGWSLYFTLDIIGYTILFGFQHSVFINAFVSAALGVGLTHLFRLVIRKDNWIKLPVSRLLFRAFIGVFIITNIMVAINLPMDSLLLNKEILLKPVTIISYFANLSKPVLIWTIVYLFYHYVEERKNDEVERIRLKSSIKDSEAKVLKAQMNPHFMFNALNSIRALVIEDPAKAQLGITQLSNILRSSLIADRRTTISLKEELKTIEDYLGLEKVRYEERLQVKWEIAPETLPIQVPPMMLQTLVENAIKHGVQKAISWGFVEIYSSLIKKELHIKIRNTGKLKGTESSSEVGGFGLKNTVQRLSILYGDEAKFEIYQESEQTVCAEITIPIEKVIGIQERTKELV